MNESQPEGLMLDFTSPYGNYILTFEDDGKVAYAYLKKGCKIIGDVWLYNRCPTPDLPEWTDKNKIHFANCRDFMMPEGRLHLPVLIEDVLVNWEDDREVKESVAYIYIFEDLFGVVGPGDKPGYARFARADSPLAKVMEIV